MAAIAPDLATVPGADGDRQLEEGQVPATAATPLRGPAQWLARWLTGRVAQGIVVTFWLGLVIGGFLALGAFFEALATSAPPVHGSRSEEADEAFGRYFPGKSIQGVLLLQSSSGVPFARFVNRSTCQLVAEASVSSGTLTLNYACPDGPALGGGCISKADLGPQMFAATAKAVADILPASDAQALMGFMGFVLPTVTQALPDTLCPEAVDDDLTQRWLGFPAVVLQRLQKQLPRCESTVDSFLSVPPVPLAYESSVEQMNMTVNVTGMLPAGTLWGLVRNQLLTDSGTSALLAASTAVCNGHPIEEDMGQDAQDFSDALGEAAGQAPAGISARATSPSLMAAASDEGVNATMNMSAMTVPIALAILAVMVRNVRLVICTALNLLCCLTGAILITYPVASRTVVSSSAPALMIAVALAMSIDYSLFLLTRFQKEMTAGKTPEEAVTIMLATSGKIVLVSGTTLLLCFLMMLVLPVMYVATMGVGAAFAVLTALAAGLTLTPTMLLIFPEFFSSNRCWGLSTDGLICFRRCRSPSAPTTGSEAWEANGHAPHKRAENQEAIEERPQGKGWWSRCGKQTQRCAIPALLVLVGIAAPLAGLSLPRLTHSGGLMPFMPTDNAATQTAMALQEAFGVGVLFPTSLLVVPPDDAMSTDESRASWLQQCCEALQAVAADANTDPDVPPFLPTAFAGAMILGGSCSTSGMGTWSDVGSPHSATQVSINYQLDPFSADGQRWIKRMRDALDKQSSVGRWYLGGEAGSEMDAADATFGRFPLMVVLMLVVVSVLMGVSFGSLIAPVRAVLCLAWMLAVTFGLAVFIFQDGWLNFLHWSQLGARPTGAMSWMSPCIACSVVVGLGLDYDCFYSECVLEEWEHGHSEKDAAIRALASTATTISAAGLIMVVAFLPMLVCTTPSLNEIGFLLIVGVLLDCFVTTKIIIPCTVSLLGRFNFWPRRAPLQAPKEIVDAVSESVAAPGEVHRTVLPEQTEVGCRAMQKEEDSLSVVECEHEGSTRTI